MRLSTAQIDPTRNLQWVGEIVEPSITAGATDTAVAAAESRVNALVRIGPEDRLGFLGSIEWGFNGDHIRQVNWVLDEFLDTSAKREIRRIAAQVFDIEKATQAIVDQWFTEEQRDRLIRLLDSTEVPDRMTVACYAWLEIHEAALAAHLLHMHRIRPRPDWDGFTQRPTERAEDLRSVNAV
jgi:hypothetical protein